MPISPTFLRRERRSKLAAGLAVLALMAACGREGGQPDGQLAASSGQVKPAQGASVTRFAAARFADQVSFGATPALVAEIQSKGFEHWIDDQFALPPTLIDTHPIDSYDSQIAEQGQRGYRYAVGQLYSTMLTAPDQLRWRVTWSLEQYITTAMNKIEPHGTLAYANLLQRYGTTNYGDLLRAVSTNPSMGIYLDNLQNRPTSTECPWCSPNENYARELMQLFTLGVVKLNPDGTVQRDGAGKPIETYTQKDVTELARALTGWMMDANYDRTDFRRYDGVLIPDPWSAAHDRGAKTVLGKALGANVDASKELDAIVALLMGHQNIAPFVSLRLIQHLVTSNPSPAYLARVAAVFRNNGKGVAGDMKAVVKAILLDPEARRGDQIGADSNEFGKMREPVLWYTSALRGLGCTQALTWDNGVDMMLPSQRPFDPTSVFSFYMPTDRAPGSNLLAPEQRLLTAEELSFRLNGGFSGGIARAGSACAAGALGKAFASSPAAFADLVSERFFRGAMPAVLRQNLIDLAGSTWGSTPDEKAISLLQFALATPYYGVIR
jgi:uncharacterized protein (DUF1800 family)